MIYDVTFSKLIQTSKNKLDGDFLYDSRRDDAFFLAGLNDMLLTVQQKAFQ